MYMYIESFSHIYIFVYMCVSTGIHTPTGIGRESKRARESLFLLFVAVVFYQVAVSTELANNNCS